MRRRFLPLSLVVSLTSLLLGCAAAQGPVLEQVVSGISRPVVITHAHDARLFIVEQGGVIELLKDGALNPTPFLDITARVSSDGERGLLGLAFPSDHAASGRFYVYYTDRDGDTVVSRFSVSADPDRADAGSEEVLLTQDQPASNHNGGQLAFGPDGYLYIGIGDGGGSGDPRGNAQAMGHLLGKLLRIDVSGDSGYAVPSSNPFIDNEWAMDEIWATGLRNPWRFSFDSLTGDLYIADVGQNAIEEVNVQSTDSPGGENYGWNIMEGDACFQPSTGCDRSGLTLPAFSYRQGAQTGASITGGYVYRGEDVPSLIGLYVYGDFVSGRIWGTSQASGWSQRPLVDSGFRISTFGEDATGELYVADYSSGRIYRFTEP